MSAPRPRWSVVIPAFNEARRLPPYLAEVAAYFPARVSKLVLIDAQAVPLQVT